MLKSSTIHNSTKVSLKDFDTCLRLITLLEKFPGVYFSSSNLVQVIRPELKETAYNNRFSLFGKIGILVSKKGGSTGGYKLNENVLNITVYDLYEDLEPHFNTRSKGLPYPLIWQWSSIYTSSVYKGTSIAYKMYKDMLKIKLGNTV